MPPSLSTEEVVTPLSSLSNRPRPPITFFNKTAMPHVSATPCGSRRRSSLSSFLNRRSLLEFSQCQPAPPQLANPAQQPPQPVGAAGAFGGANQQPPRFGGAPQAFGGAAQGNMSAFHQTTQQAGAVPVFGLAPQQPLFGTVAPTNTQPQLPIQPPNGMNGHTANLHQHQHQSQVQPALGIPAAIHSQQHHQQYYGVCNGSLAQLWQHNGAGCTFFTNQEGEYYTGQVLTYVGQSLRLARAQSLNFSAMPDNSPIPNRAPNVTSVPSFSNGNVTGQQLAAAASAASNGVINFTQIHSTDEDGLKEVSQRKADIIFSPICPENVASEFGQITSPDTFRNYYEGKFVQLFTGMLPVLLLPPTAP